MTIQLFYQPKDHQQFVDDARITNGIAFTTYLPDGSEVYSIRTDEEMEKNLLIKPIKDWKQITNTNSLK